MWAAPSDQRSVDTVIDVTARRGLLSLVSTTVADSSLSYRSWLVVCQSIVVAA